MKKKEVIKLVIKSVGLTPYKVERIKEKGDKAWRGKGIDKNNEVLISFNEKGGIENVISEIVSQAKSAELKPADQD